MCLNAMSVDPGRTWKGVWRWYAEDMLDCCVPIDDIKSRGIDLEEFACLARCNGLKYPAIVRPPPISSTNISDQVNSIEAFRKVVLKTCQQDLDTLVVSYSRKGLKQTGDGHYSPIGAYDEDTDSVLILDVARFKYPPHWVKLQDLYISMRYLDSTTKKPRGWMLLQKEKITCVCSSLWTCAPGNTIRRLLHEVMSIKKSIVDIRTRVKIICSLLIESKVKNILQHREFLSEDHIKDVKQLLHALETTKIFDFIVQSFKHEELQSWTRKLATDLTVDLRHVLSILVLSLPRDLLLLGEEDESFLDIVALEKEEENGCYEKLGMEIRAVGMQIEAFQTKMMLCRHDDISSDVDVVVSSSSNGSSCGDGKCCKKKKQ